MQVSYQPFIRKHSYVDGRPYSMHGDMPKVGSKTSIDVLVCESVGLLWNHLYFVFKQQALFSVGICCSVISDMALGGTRDRNLISNENKKSTGPGYTYCQGTFPSFVFSEATKILGNNSVVVHREFFFLKYHL